MIALLVASIVALVPTVWIPRGRVFEAALEDAVREGQVTPRLTAAFNDRTLRASRIYERLATAAIIVLMVTKPF